MTVRISQFSYLQSDTAKTQNELKIGKSVKEESPAMGACSVLQEGFTTMELTSV